MSAIEADNRKFSATRAKLHEARAAVAELIEAAERLERKSIPQSRTTSSVFTSDVEALRAALARVGGAP